MCNAAGAYAGAQGVQGIFGAVNAGIQGKMESQYYGYMANKDKEQIDLIDKANQDQIYDIKTQEAKDVAKNANQYDQLASTQKAAMAANGVLNDSGTYQDILTDTYHKQALDEAAIRYNSQNKVIEQSRAALSSKNQLNADMLSMQVRGINAMSAAKLNQVNSLIGGSTQAASTYASFNKYGSGKSFNVLNNSNWSIA